MLSSDIFSTIGDRNLSQKARQVGLPAMIRSGLPPGSAFSIQNTIGASNQALEKIIGLSYRTLQRYKEKSRRLSPVVSDRIVRFLNVLNDASKTLGTVESGVAWMNRPCQPLGNQKPIEMLDTVAGTSEVVDILGRIRHGVFS